MKNKGENKSKDRIIKELHKKIKELEKLETQRKQVEKELRLSEAKFRGLFENVFDGVYQATPDGKIISANPALVRMLGYDSETDLRAIDIAYDLYADPEERKILSRKLEKKGELRNAELVLKRKDGRQVIVLENARAVHDEQGKVLYYEGTLTDITERKKMEEVLRDRIKELNCFYNISYLVEKPDTSLEEIFQWIVNLIPPAWQYSEITCARIIAKGQGFKTENFRETAWTQDTDIVVHGKPIGTLKVCYLEERPERDEGPFLKEERSLLNAIASRLGKIIERREAEEALRKSEEKYRDSIELAPDAIITLDMKGMVTSCNTVAAKLSDFSKDEIIGKHFSKLGFLREKDIPKYIELFVSAVAGKIFEPFEIMWYHKDGTARLGEVRFSVIEEDDNVVGIQTIVRDITERKKAEELLKKQKEELSAFTYTISHNLKNYITIIQSYAKFLLLKKEGAKENTQKIIDVTKKMNEFVTRQLELADAGRAIGEPKKVDLNTVVDEIGKMYSIEIHPEDLPTITGDPRRLREVFNNLIDNAIKHGGADRIEISSEKKKDSYVIYVKDNGRGIPKEDIDKIFDIWYSKTGTGFGLTIVKKIVEAHGGSISVKSEEGKGTIFGVVLPKM
jgi:PAS domain S-box-containing protein